MTDSVTTYAADVIAGKVVAGRLVRLACERHRRDLEHGHERGLHFDAAAAAHTIGFFPKFLRLAEAEHADTPFVLQPWQQFIVGSLFGWKRADGYRRFRTGYVEIAKGNGKTPMGAGIELYGLTMDGERGAQIYTAAVSRDQANLMFTDAATMARNSPELAARLEILEHNIAFHAEGSFIRPVSSEARSLDGKRVHMAMIDELHEHPNALVVNKMRAGTKGRRQALIFEITNSGYDRHSICYQHHELSERILEQRPGFDDDTWFAYVCTLDACAACRAKGKSQPTEGCTDCDDWTDEAVWPKVNPNLGVSIPLSYLRDQVRDALAMPAVRNLNQRLNFCLWNDSYVVWLPADAWRACGQPLRSLVGRRGILGLDLSSTTDLTALVALFPDDDGSYDVLARFWMPRDNVAERVKRDRAPYDVWAREGVLTLTDGNVIDYDFILAEILALPEREHVEIAEVAFDPWNATGLVTDLQNAGITCAPIRQGFASLTAPSKALETLIAKGLLRHAGHPVLALCAANAVAEVDAAGNIKPSKSHSTGRIDGIAALVNALSRAIVQDTPPEPRMVAL